MNAVIRRRRIASIGALTILALLWHALMPLAAAAAPPRASVTLCTALGVRVVAVETDSPSSAPAAVDHCPLCRLADAADAPLPVCSGRVGHGTEPVHAGSDAAAQPAPCDPWTPAAPRAPPAA